MPRSRSLVGTVAIVAFLLLPSEAHAGMPSLTLTDFGRMRLSTLSFFLAGFLLSALGIQRIWNMLQRDFPSLPRLSFKSAAGIVFLWGMLFVLVLTMISGARELMTPGAWKKQGLTYKLADSESAGTQSEERNALLRRREEQLQKLHVELLSYAARHDGQYPPDDSTEGGDAETWNLPERLGTRYRYVAGRSVREVAEVVAYEPQVYDDQQFVLWTDGRVQRMSTAELQHSLRPESTP